MALIIRNALDIYYKINNVYDDVRVRDMLLLSNPFKPVTLLAVYLYFVLNWGPKYMEKRKPMKLDNIIKCYNLLQVAVCSYITIKGFYHTFGQGYSLICEPVDYSLNYHPVQLTKVAHYYFLTKVVDLFDTVFFVLKKKQSHVSFLHVYHHAGMVMLAWIGLKYVSGGHSAFMGVLNSFVHVIMYFYYYLTSVDNKYKQSFWKKYITQLQMIQFGLMALHWFTLIIAPDCGYPKWFSFFMLPQNFFIFILFYDFYRKTYFKKTEVNNKLDCNHNAAVEDSRNISEVPLTKHAETGSN
ncbi:CLUMA_CG000692, isoform A [Clunio marinus]|uniref:Elongation of very long chain fatty acids protein n=1 Tax=Clunio marinus TaxID=568069 RepID=A0A1J1HH34_9DIPT|nr:CLUMA_CG000692, isoform A [Clunio marinus]